MEPDKDKSSTPHFSATPDSSATQSSSPKACPSSRQNQSHYIEGSLPRISREKMLFEQIKENPNDDSLRLLLAEHYESLGMPVRARFIREQIRVYQSSPTDSDLAAAQKWIRTIEKKNFERFHPGVPHGLVKGNLFEIVAERGLPHTIVLNPLTLDPDVSIILSDGTRIAPLHSRLHRSMRQVGVTNCFFIATPNEKQLSVLVTVAPNITNLIISADTPGASRVQFPKTLTAPHITSMVIHGSRRVTSLDLEDISRFAPNLTALYFNFANIGVGAFTECAPNLFPKLKLFGVTRTQLPSPYEVLAIPRVASSLETISCHECKIHRAPYKGGTFSIDISSLKEINFSHCTGISGKFLSAFISKGNSLQSLILEGGSIKRGTFEKLEGSSPNASIQRVQITSLSQFSDKDVEIIPELFPNAEVHQTKPF